MRGAPVPRHPGAQILAIDHQDVEGIQLDFVIVFAREHRQTPRMTASPSTDQFAQHQDNKSFANVSEVTGNSRIEIEGFAKPGERFNGLARKPLCYRYTIPPMDYLTSSISYGIVRGSRGRRSRQIAARSVAPFDSPPAGPGKRVAKRVSGAG